MQWSPIIQWFGINTFMLSLSPPWPLLRYHFSTFLLFVFLFLFLNLRIHLLYHPLLFLYVYYINFTQDLRFFFFISLIVNADNIKFHIIFTCICAIAKASINWPILFYFSDLFTHSFKQVRTRTSTSLLFKFTIHVHGFLCFNLNCCVFNCTLIWVTAVASLPLKKHNGIRSSLTVDGAQF